MAEFTIREVLEATGGVLKKKGTGCFLGVSTDTRTLRPGMLFIPLKGGKRDGHSFIRKAVRKGAGGVLFSQNVSIPKGVVSIKVPDTVRALGALALCHRRRFDLSVVGITGSNGKTTTKEMLAGILSRRFKVLKSKRSFNNLVGVPLTLLGLTPAHSAAIIEMGMSAKGEIAELAGIAVPSVGVITNVGSAHLAYFSSISRIADAKGELLEALGRARLPVGQEASAVLNRDSPFFKRLKKMVKCRLITFGFTSKSDFYPEDVRILQGRTTFKLSGKKISLKSAGRHNVYNALTAAAAANAFGIGGEEIKEGLEDFAPPPMRMEIIKRGNVTIINDSYNANPESMREALGYLAGLGRKGNVCIVIGDMLELGRNSKKCHFEAGFLAGKAGNFVISFGEFAQDVARGAQAAGLSPDAVFACGDIKMVKKGTGCFFKKNSLSPFLVFLKGSRAMKMERVLKYI